MSERNLNQVRIWLEGDVRPSGTITSGLYFPNALVTTITGDIFIANGVSDHRINKWTLNATNSLFTILVPQPCLGLFIDIIDRIYCSTENSHQVVRTFVTNEANTATIVAGASYPGSTPDLLNQPRGLFVDDQFNLYVADYYNNRIQLFSPGQLNATTVAGAGTNGTISLFFPTGVVLDADKYLFIADFFNSRIIGSGPHGFRCVAGCSGVLGSTANLLWQTDSLSFDSYGNLFVADAANNRVQKFLLEINSCGKCHFNLLSLFLSLARFS